MIIPATPTYNVIIRGDLAAAAEAAGNYTNSPLRDTATNGYGNTHGKLTISPEALSRWWQEIEGDAPGALLYYRDPAADTNTSGVKLFRFHAKNNVIPASAVRQHRFHRGSDPSGDSPAAESEGKRPAWAVPYFYGPDRGPLADDNV